MNNYLFKIILAGSTEENRTMAINWITNGQFQSNNEAKIAINFAFHHQILPKNDWAVDLQIWDLGEEKRFRSMVSTFCKGAMGAILYFTQMELNNLNELIDWIKMIRIHNPDIPIILCGISKDETQLHGEIIQDFIQKYEIPHYIEINLSNGRHIKESFEILSKIMVERWASLEHESTHPFYYLLSDVST